jgi:hypothetical protein
MAVFPFEAIGSMSRDTALAIGPAINLLVTDGCAGCINMLPGAITLKCRKHIVTERPFVLPLAKPGDVSMPFTIVRSMPERGHSA